MSNQHKHPTISFRVSDAERKQIEARIAASGMMKKDYFVRSCIYNHICVVGKKETIYPLVQTVNALYLRLLEMQKVFVRYYQNQNSDNLPTSNKITELQTSYNNMLKAIIELLDGAKYLWEGDTMKQNNSCYLFGMYEPDTDSIVVYANDIKPFIINCQKCNSSVILDNPDDIVYLYRLAQDAPLLYAELALKADGLQGYADAMNEFN